MSVIQGNAIESGLAAYEIPNSLKFNSADSAYLSRTPSSSPTGTTKGTWSFWIKRTKLATEEYIFGSRDGGNSANTMLRFESGDTLRFYQHNGSSVTWNLITTQVFRDVGAWMHILVALDTTQATDSNRIKIYVNGTQITAFGTASYPSQNANMTRWAASGVPNYIGNEGTTPGGYGDYYLTETYFIDGQALDPTSFGEYNSETGVWQPKEYTGSYGTNGFYLPMTQDQIVEGFNTVLYRGNGASSQKITGVGFTPDLLWIKNRSLSANHGIWDSVRGGNGTSLYRLYTDTTDAETTGSTNSVTSLDPDGFTVTSLNSVNGAGYNYVGWCWDAGNSTVSNTDGTITSSVRASQTYGFSVVTWTNAGNGNDTVGHGLGTAPKLIITKKRSTANDWYTFTTAIDGSYDYLKLNATDAKVDSAKAAPTSTVFTTDMGDTSTAVAYCFTDSNYSKFGSYTGNGSSTGPTVTLGWRPAFVMVKNTSNTAGWMILDNTRDTVNNVDKSLYANSSSAESTGDDVEFTDTGFQIKNTYGTANTNGDTYIYAAFKDQREAAFWRDFSGNGNHWQPNNLDFNDSVVDVPTNYGTDTGVGAEVRGNYCTFNPLLTNNLGTFADGNLTTTTGSAASTVGTTFGMTTGKWYAEFVCTAKTSVNMGVAIVRADKFDGDNQADEGNNIGYLYLNNGSVYHGFASDAYGATWDVNDVIGVAFDADTRNVTFYKNGTSQGTYTRIASENAAGFTWLMAVCEGQGSATATFKANFGQLPFAYTAPSGYKALCTHNLPDPAIADGSTAMNVVTYTGNDSQSITGVGFQPDLVWVKSRSSGAYNHQLHDSVRGATAGMLASNSTAAEDSLYQFDSFDADGFTTDSGNITGVNNSGQTFVAWNWKAGGTGVSNTAGSITSTVSANTTAGFSIVTYTGNGTSGATVGHGLGAEPYMMILKARTQAESWGVYHKFGDANPQNGFFRLEGTGTFVTSSSQWNNTAPGSSVFTLGNDTRSNRNGYTYVMYAFAPVAGFSAFGKYVGSGSQPGTFTYLGFKPAFLLIKEADGIDGWGMYDDARNTYNPESFLLQAQDSGAESSAAANYIDFLSNGFRVCTGGSQGNFINESGKTYIYAAWASNPFKYSLAR